MSFIPDFAARQKALQTSTSFIVQAPAGSGKTELLVQRFLALLGIVSTPEEIIAITFTRKAASEMRERIINALSISQNPPPQVPHAYQTWQLAKNALEQDHKQNWQLLKNPNRLRVLTIDALCASITRQSPLLSGLGAATSLEPKDIESYYIEASRRVLSALEKPSHIMHALSKLLLHLDTRLDKLESLFVNMLGKRDQWLPHIVSKKNSLKTFEIRQQLEENLHDVVEETLSQCEKAMPEFCREELFDLLAFVNHAQQKPARTNPGATTRRPAIRCMDSVFQRGFASSSFCSVPYQALEEKIDFWIALSDLVLTDKGELRQRVDKRHGFPADAKAIKQRMHAVLKDLISYTDFQEKLIALRYLPQTQYTHSQWEILAALFELLPVLVAELKVLFKEKNVCDFTEIALAANIALGDKDNPTDLTLLLDTQIQHLLVDEFQDTSLTQFNLLEKLTVGWEPYDGRTLFLVGDPMQSIYRFRAAEVGLFLKVQQEGLGFVHLESLTLQTNFRASPVLVDWINTQFSSLFPKESDIQNGRVSFSPCVSTKNLEAFSCVVLEKHPPENITLELLNLLKELQTTAPEENTVILVRSRTHLRNILPVLKQANIPFNAVEIDRLYAQSIVQDLLSLTGALLHLGDRLSWLAILRAPWCGLTLHDLYYLTHFENPESRFLMPIWHGLQHLEDISDLSDEGKQRLTIILPVLQNALAERGRLSLRRWVENTWMALNGPDYLSNENEWNSVQSYFKILDLYDANGEMPDLQTIRAATARQYTSPPANTGSSLHVMTIHKAKGLEFDTVIVPHLELSSQSDAAQLLLWLERPHPESEAQLFLAPIKASSEKSDPVYRWLQYTDQNKAKQELIRLLYVAATRAKSRLYLLATESEQKPRANSFLGLLEQNMEKDP